MNTVIALLNRFMLWQKFVVVSMVALVLTSIPTYFYVQEVNKAIDMAEMESQGLLPTNTVLRAMQLTQHHRGLSAIYLGGVTSAKDRLEAKLNEVDAAYKVVSVQINQIPDKAVQEN